MTLRTIRRSILGSLAAALFALAPLSSPARAAETPEAAPAQEANASSVQGEINEQLAERRKAMLAEAQSAIDETSAAVTALDEGDTQAALAALARATGVLELLVARDPDLALAPVDVTFVTHDLYATPTAIRMARERVEELVDDGKLQEARNLLSGLASETVVRVTNLPLATYPAAIKAISPLIDDGKIEEAKTALNVALSTLVVTDQVVSLPVVRARAALDEAQALVDSEAPSDEDKKRVDELVQVARKQLEIAELLGYGDARDYQRYHSEIAKLEAKIRDDQATEGVFSELRRSLEELQTSFFE